MKRDQLGLGLFITLTLWMMLFLVGCDLSPIGPVKQLSAVSATPASSFLGKNPLHIVRIIDKQSLLPCGSLLVADVTVRTVGAAQWNTVDGKRPSLPGPLTAAVLHSGYYIYSQVQFSHLQPLFDRRTQPTEFFITMGGQVGQDQYQMVGYPQLQVGRRYLVIFALRYNVLTATTTQHWLVADEAYSINGQGMIVLPNKSTRSAPNGEDVPGPTKLVSLTDFAKQFASCT